MAKPDIRIVFESGDVMEVKSKHYPQILQAMESARHSTLLEVLKGLHQLEKDSKECAGINEAAKFVAGVLIQG